MSATTPGLLKPGMDANGKAKRIHPFSTPQPRWRISKTTDRSKTALLDLPAEVRLLIYNHAVIFHGAINKLPARQLELAAQNVVWVTRGAIADAFNLMQTCKTVYKEAQRIFWGRNIFTIHASPPYSIWPRPDIPTDDLRTLFDLTNARDWKITLAVDSVESQKMIRKLAWIFPKDSWHRSNNQWRENVDEAVKFNGSDIVPSNLSNVQELYVVLDATLSRRATYPTLDEVYGLIKQGTLCPSVLGRLGSDPLPGKIQAAEVFTYATTMSFRYLTSKVFPKIQAVTFVGEDSLCTAHKIWHRMVIRALPPDCLYLKRVRQAFADKSLRIGSVLGHERERCVQCLAEWTVEHWAEWNELQVCPGLGYVEAD